ncbi:carbon-nitrogen hydrolase family protein [Eubacterium ventriosum]|uniref:Carbon-nitrogen hydrolase family protein n=1 Tax=Eubacterium ventriosum TaxID=39496 RepID=A0A413RUJ3_9FIRM|nr:carbon-nitrogen hydrolase family protein [Eubacterium ventriosum]RHA51980.1 carbon-nitrogen hydrolase family protein [Eubacterium ventriosum]
MKLKVAMVQYDANEPDIDFNTKVAMKYIKEAKESGADIVLFPECFLTAYCCPDIVEELLPLEELENDSEFIDWCNSAVTEEEEHVLQIRKLAKELQIGVVITAFTKGEKYPQNTAIVIDKNGDIILKYSKVHTCDFDWERYLESGQEFKVCEFDGVNIGVMICYDREYPESARELMLQGAEIIFNPNNCGGMEPRLKELSVRAMENMVGVAMANPPAPGMGRSAAFNPMVWGENGEVLDNTIIVAEEFYEGIVYAEFDIDIIRKYRENEDLGKFRKPRAYKSQ